MLLRDLEQRWREPDNGIWEIRGEPQHFVHSKVMAWVAFDRAVRTIEEYGLEGDLDGWRATRDEIHEEVCREGFDEQLGSFTQFYGSGTLDASLLLIPLVGFLPCSDPRVARHDRGDPARPHLGRPRAALSQRGGRGRAALRRGRVPAVLVLARRLPRADRRPRAAHALFDRLLGLCNDLGLIAEEYDPTAKRLLGNFPQAFTHLELVNSAFNLAKKHDSPMELRHARR